MRHSPIDSKLFIKNRHKLKRELKPNSLVIVHSNDEMPRNGDQYFPFRQNSDLLYLSGIPQEKTILAICPDHPITAYREILFIIKSNEQLELWNGHKLTFEEARNISGIETIVWLDDFDEIYTELKVKSEYVYLNLNEETKAHWEFPYRDLRFAEQVKSRFPIHKYERLGPIISRLRTVKEPEEIEYIRKACNITEKAFIEAIKKVKPNCHEYEIEAAIIAEFIRNGASGHSFSPIVASGKNACTLHYNENHSGCNNEELLLLDFGAEYGYYAGDCSRTVPVNGKFSTRQKELYNSVLHVMRQAKQFMVPGTTINSLNTRVGELMRQEHIKLGLYTNADVKNEDAEKPLWKKYYPHGTSHFIGLDVHDVGSKDLPFEPGMVLSCEPGIYISEEKIGIRLETVVLIGEQSPIDLMENVPIEIDDIEKLMLHF